MAEQTQRVTEHFESEHDQRVQKVVQCMTELATSYTHLRAGTVPKDVKDKMESLLRVWFPRNLPEKASKFDIALVGQGLVSLNLTPSFANAQAMTVCLSAIITPYLPRLWAWARFIWKTDEQRYAILIKHKILSDILQTIASLSYSPDLAYAIMALPNLVEDLCHIWRGDYYRPADASRFRAENAIYSSIAINRLLFLNADPSHPKFQVTVNAVVRFWQTLGGPENIAMVYVAQLQEILAAKDFLKEFLTKEPLTPAPEHAPSACLFEPTGLLFHPPAEGFLFKWKIESKFVQFISTLADYVAEIPDSTVDMSILLRTIPMTLFSSRNRGGPLSVDRGTSSERLINVLSESQDTGLLSLLWKVPFDETTEHLRRTMVLIFKGLCNHLIYPQVISSSLDAIARVESVHAVKIKSLPESSLLKRLWRYYTALAEEYGELKIHWSNRNQGCAEVDAA